MCEMFDNIHCPLIMGLLPGVARLCLQAVSKTSCRQVTCWEDSDWAHSPAPGSDLLLRKERAQETRSREARPGCRWSHTRGPRSLQLWVTTTLMKYRPPGSSLDAQCPVFMWLVTWAPSACTYQSPRPPGEVDTQHGPHCFPKRFRHMSHSYQGMVGTPETPVPRGEPWAGLAGSPLRIEPQACVILCCACAM